MDEATYKNWWPLHIRIAKGETVTSEEQSFYEAGCQELDAEENLDGGINALRQSREGVQKLKEEYLRLLQRYEALESERLALEARLSEKDKQLLGVGDV